jgi:ribosomal protein S27AE
MEKESLFVRLPKREVQRLRMVKAIRKRDISEQVLEALAQINKKLEVEQFKCPHCGSILEAFSDFYFCHTCGEEYTQQELRLEKTST